MGDTISVVTYHPSVGTNLNANNVETVKLSDPGFDLAALLAVSDATKKPELASKVVTVQALKLAPQQAAELMADGKFKPTESFRGVLSENQATHLLVVTRIRAEARIMSDRDGIGSGRLEGLGFYLDRERLISRGDTGEMARGFLAPFAYFKLSLVDLASSTIVAEKSVTASHTVAGVRNKTDADPWNALNATEKVNALNRLIRAPILDAMPELMNRP